LSIADVMPDIPGYELREVIGRGGMSTVYLGISVASHEQVAIKLINDDLAQAPNFVTRFEKNAKLHQSLRHPNIARVVDFGHAPAGYYIVAEYLSGGDLNDGLQRGMPLQALVKVVKDMARALDYIHAVGIIHCDVKPENILFRGDGTAVLTDFGIALELSERPSISAKGTVVGTPEYMSPEQAAGRPIDGRSDLYSLGVVLFRMLTGDVPFKADTAVSTGVKHLQDPIPRLPNYLHVFQAVIEHCLAKKPEQRIASGEALVKELDLIRSSPAMPEATIKTEPISTQEIIAVGGDLLSTQRDPARQDRHFRRHKRRRRLQAVAGTLALLLAIGGTGYYGYQQGWIEPERLLAQLGIGEDPLLVVAWSEAQSLRQDPNQGLATIVAGYRRVLAIDPDHTGAKTEVANLASVWKDSIRTALAKGSLQNAQTRLQEAREVFPDDLEWIQLEVEFENRQRAERIMVSAQGLLTSNGMSDLPSATAAIQSFQEVLRLAPEHPGATQVLNEIAEHFVGLASTAVKAGEVSVAINLLERASAANGTLTGLDEVRKLISQATTAQAAIEELLQQARNYRAANQLIMPTGENAAELYHRVLATDPDNVFAAQGLDEVTAQITEQADQLLADGKLDAVSLLVSQAATAGMSDAVVNEIRRRLDAEQTRLQTIAANIAKATTLIEAGYLTAPTDNNAVTYLREVQQLDPGNETAAALLARCAQRLAAVAREAYEFGLYDAAKQYLDLALTITPEVADWVALRDSWEGAQES
jgi:serine/threonine-protein kinase PpkA